MDNVIINELLNKEDFIDLISCYYSKKLKKEIKISYELSITYDSVTVKPDVVLSYDENVLGKKKKVILTYNDIYDIIEDYVNDRGYELDSFKYNGDIKHIGYVVNMNESVFNGIKISMYRGKLTLVKCLFKKRR